MQCVGVDPAISNTTDLAKVISVVIDIAISMAKSHFCRAGSLHPNDQEAAMHVLRDELHRSGLDAATAQEVAPKLFYAICQTQDPTSLCGGRAALNTTDTVIMEGVRLANETLNLAARGIQGSFCTGYDPSIDPGVVRAQLDALFPSVEWFDSNLSARSVSCAQAFEHVARQFVINVRERAIYLYGEHAPSRTTDVAPAAGSQSSKLPHAQRLALTIVIQFLFLDNIEVSKSIERLISALGQIVCRGVGQKRPEELRHIMLGAVTQIIATGCAEFAVAQGQQGAATMSAQEARQSSMSPHPGVR
jgi:hypothetical protein